MDIVKYFEKVKDKVDRRLEALLQKGTTYPHNIHEAMRYAVLNGGKRIRPILTLTCCEAVGGGASDALVTACAIELIHAYSLVHDDLPCMDDDDFRRGKPTVHKQYGEAIAVLSGDGLLTYAFELLAGIKPAKSAIRVIRELSTAVGTKGMIGGQVVDIEFSDKKPTLPIMDYINIHKTGKLIAASCHAGAIMGNARIRDARALLAYGEYLGLVFQLVDDIIDHDGYATVFGERDCVRRADELTRLAKKAVARVPKKVNVLIAIADFVRDRRK
ncbi:MAG: polyprenyl synthetase family protein [Candidatus Omnitrophica bacterium]|nr:polyprenyl synthetase family protein [Candidatus Omnitrophota bacterium]